MCSPAPQTIPAGSVRRRGGGVGAANLRSLLGPDSVMHQHRGIHRTTGGTKCAAKFLVRLPLWFLNADGFTPDKRSCDAFFEMGGAMPVGEAVWRYADSASGERTLTVAEL